MQKDLRLGRVNLPNVSFDADAATEYQRASYLPTDRVTGDRTETCIPQPSQHVRGGLHTRVRGAAVVGVCLLLSVCHDGVPFLGHSNAHKQEIALLECDAAFFGDLLDVRQTDLMSREGAIFNAFLLGPSGIVDQHSTAYTQEAY